MPVQRDAENNAIGKRTSSPPMVVQSSLELTDALTVAPSDETRDELHEDEDPFDALSFFDRLDVLYSPSSLLHKT